MSIPNSDTDPLSVLSRRRESDLHLRAQQSMEVDQMQGMQFFAFLFSLFTGMKPEEAGMKSEEGLSSQQAIKEFASIFHIDTTTFQKTVDSYRSGDVSAHEAARQTYNQTTPTEVDMEQAKQVATKFAEDGNPLLAFIGELETNVHGYCTAWDGSGTGEYLNLPEMTVDEVLKWQEQRRENGYASTAVGALQVIYPTLKGLKRNMELKGDEFMTKELQQKMMVSLLEEKGYSKMLAGEMPVDKFIAEASKVWSSIPKDIGGKSSHEGIGDNKALTSYATVCAVVRETQQYEAAKQQGLTGKYNENLAKSGVAEHDPKQPDPLKTEHDKTIASEGTDEVKVAAAKEAEQPQSDDPAVISTTSMTV